MAKETLARRELRGLSRRRVVICVIQTLSIRCVPAAKLLAWLVYHLDKRHRRVADDNLRHAFPTSTPPAATLMVRGRVPALLQLLIEIIHVRASCTRRTGGNYLDLKGGRKLVDALLSGAAADRHGPLRQLGDGRLRPGRARLHDARHRPRTGQPVPRRFPPRFRERTGQKVLAKKVTSTRCSRSWAGRRPATLADQDAGRQGAVRRLLQTAPRRRHKAVALMALSTTCR